jgi:sulfur relay (sulfurtransferase) DsrC/TusE family protein
MTTTKYNSDWTTAVEAWNSFVASHPELGYRAGHWQLHNFLRHFRDQLRSCDAIRMAKHKHWIAHRERFRLAAFECATGMGVL